MVTIVKTKEELKKAVKRKDKTIIVEGDLVNEVKKSEKIKTVSKRALIALSGIVGIAAVAAPFTGGASLSAGLVAAAETGVSAGVIYAAISVGGLLVAWAIHNNYEIHFELDSSSGKPKLTLKLKPTR